MGRVHADHLKAWTVSSEVRHFTDRIRPEMGNDTPVTSGKASVRGSSPRLPHHNSNRNGHRFSKKDMKRKKVFTLGKTGEIEEKRVKPNVIRRRAPRAPVGEAASPLSHSEGSIKIDGRKQEVEETIKINSINPKKIAHKGEIAIMKMQEIREIAIIWGVDARIGRSKQDIIRDIQIKEGFSPCFETKDTCDNDCMWKTDCIGKKQ